MSKATTDHTVIFILSLYDTPAGKNCENSFENTLKELSCQSLLNSFSDLMKSSFGVLIEIRDNLKNALNTEKIILRTLSLEWGFFDIN